MFFANTSLFFVIFGLIFIILWSFFAFIIYKKNEKVSHVFFILLSVFFLVFSLFSPRFWIIDDNTQVQWWNILFIMDISKSMDVWDISDIHMENSRFWAQKEIISEFIQKYSENQFWLFWFSWDALEILPFTSDIGLFQTILSWINKNNISKNGSDFTVLFDKLENYTQNIKEPTTFVILTDGWEIETTQIKKKFEKKIKEKDIKILIVWIGSKSWGKIPDWVDFYGRPSYKIYQWKTVISQLNQQGIKQVSDKYDFDYIFISDLADKENIFAEIHKNLKKSFIQKNIHLSRDISFIFIFLWLISFLIFLFLEKYRN